MFKKLLSLSIFSLFVGQAQAAGFQLQEYSVAGMGRSFAGSGIMGDDYSALAYNPAGMEMNQKSGAQLGFTGIDVRTTVYGTSSGTNPTQPRYSGHTFTRLFRLMPNVFTQYKVNDKTTIGAGLYAPYGLATDYPNGWFGETHGQYSGITAVNFTPALSHKITDTVSLGLGLNIQYAVAHLTGAVPYGGTTDIRGHDMGLGYIAGLTWKATPTTRLGLSYRSHVRHKLTGKNEPRGSIIPYLRGNQFSMNARITTPETVLFSAAQEIGAKWTLSGSARWTRWSRFERLTLNQENRIPLNSTHENWRDTWFFALGADYKLNKNLTLRVGSAYDQSAISSPEYRTPRIPDARRIWVSGGLSYQRDNWQVDLGYAHLFIKKANAFGTADGAGYYSGHYDSKSDMGGIQFQYKF